MDINSIVKKFFVADWEGLIKRMLNIDNSGVKFDEAYKYLSLIKI